MLERLRHVPSRGGDPGRSIPGAVEPEAVKVEQDGGERLRDLLVQLMGELDPLALVLVEYEPKALSRPRIGSCWAYTNGRRQPPACHRC